MVGEVVEILFNHFNLTGYLNFNRFFLTAFFNRFL